MSYKFASFVLVGISLVFNTELLLANTQQLITTDSSSCDSTQAIIPSVSGGTSQEVINNSVSQWKNLGFVVGTVTPNESILVCSRGIHDPDELVTPEQEALNQTASVATIAISASIIQTTNVFTRLAALREQS